MATFGDKLKHWDPLNKVLFTPRAATYSLEHMPKETLWAQRPGKSPDRADAYMPMRLIQCPQGSEVLVIYSHGNTGDIGATADYFIKFAVDVGVHVLMYEYQGYGLCPGSSSEMTVNASMDLAYTFATDTLKFSPDRIVLFGRSCGTGPSTWLAARLSATQTPLAGLILQSPYLSMRDVARCFVGPAAVLIMNRWENGKVIKDVTCPCLIIHGARDALIPVAHARAIAAACTSPHSKLFVAEMADHKIFSYNNDILMPCVEFMRQLFPSLNLGREAATESWGMGLINIEDPTEDDKAKNNNSKNATPAAEVVATETTAPEPTTVTATAKETTPDVSADLSRFVTIPEENRAVPEAIRHYYTRKTSRWSLGGLS